MCADAIERIGIMIRPTVSLRDLFWLTVVTGMAAGWYLDHRQAALRYDALHQWLSIDSKGSRHQQRTQKHLQEERLGF